MGRHVSLQSGFLSVTMKFLISLEGFALAMRMGQRELSSISSVPSPPPSLPTLRVRGPVTNRESKDFKSSCLFLSRILEKISEGSNTRFQLSYKCHGP